MAHCSTKRVWPACARVPLHPTLPPPRNTFASSRRKASGCSPWHRATKGPAPVLVKALYLSLHLADLRPLPRELSLQALHTLFYAGGASERFFCTEVAVWAWAVERHLVERASMAAQVPVYAAAVHRGAHVCRV
ncbi:hypothetical protein DM02DRAFT_672553 [Periconia macrospinosa]|uniref:Uncharacterized protein n=1 Tax=Periconia macrospinosa TaxID=97972 RepID=A0A2V1DMZ3_9PLEO|nr:hypothetical protein DM02DRAFT_672553 [Periconia macrospinosa]